MKEEIFKDKTAVVTGGTRGIGEGIAFKLARQGCNVYINYSSCSSRGKAETITAEIKEMGRNSEAFQVNVADFNAVKGMFDQIIKIESKVDFLVNNAAIINNKLLMNMSPQDWQEVIDVNLTGVFNCSRSVIIPMLKQKYGKIINLSSGTALVGMPGQTNYGASKAGIIGLTKSLAREVAKYNIVVNAIAPGPIPTAMLDKTDPEFQKTIPMGRLGKVEEVASLVAYLLSEEASYITGQVIPIDGGAAI